MTALMKNRIRALRAELDGADAVGKKWKRFFVASQRRVKELLVQRDKARWSRDEWCKEARRLGSKLGL